MFLSSNIFQIWTSEKIYRLIKSPFFILPPFYVKLIITLLVIFFALMYVQIPVNPDSAVFDYIGWVISEGGSIYVDAADQNWPGQMLIHALSASLFGSNLWSYRALEIIVIVPLSCFLLYLFCRSTSDKVSALIVIPVYATLYLTLDLWNSGQRDIVASPLLILAALTMYKRFNGGKNYLLVLQGIFIAAATLIRPTLLIMAPLLFIVDCLLLTANNRKFLNIFLDHTLAFISTLAFLGLIALLGMNDGSLAAWYAISIKFPLEVYSGSVGIWDSIRNLTPYMARNWLAFWPAIIIGAYWFYKNNPRAFYLLITLFPAGVISVLVQGKALGYHLTVWYPLIAVLISIALSSALKNLQIETSSIIKGGLLALLISLTLAGLLKKSYNIYKPVIHKNIGVISDMEFYQRYTAGDTLSIADTIEISQHIKSSTNPNDTVLLWGRTCHINTFAERRSPFFAISSAMLFEADANYSEFDKWKQQLQDTFTHSPPKVLILVKDKTGNYIGLQNINTEDKLAYVIINALKNYRFEKKIGSAHLYRLNQP